MNNRLRYMARGLLPVILSAAAVGFLLWNTDQDGPTIQTIASVEDREALLNIYNWADYIDPQILVDFEQEYGVEVNYDIYDSSEMVDAKLMTGRTGYDIVVHSSSFKRI